MMTDNGEPGATGTGKKDDGEAKNVQDNSVSLKKVIRILRFMQLLVEGHFS